jgi:hypothetical protein
MSWKDTLKMHCNSGEKMDCGCAKCSEKTNKALSDKQKKLDKNKNGKIDGGDFAMLRNEKKIKKAEKKYPEYNMIRLQKDIPKVLKEIEKEGGALGMKNLKGLGIKPENLSQLLNFMIKQKIIYAHKHGDFYTHEFETYTRFKGKKLFL